MSSNQVYLRVVNESRLLKIVHDINPDHPCIEYEDKDSEEYKTISSWHDRNTVVSRDDFNEVKATDGFDILGKKFLLGYKGSIDLGTLHETHNGILYSPQRDAYLRWSFGRDQNYESKEFKYLGQVIPQINLLGLDLEDDTQFIDPTDTTFTPEMLERAVKYKAIAKTEMPVPRKNSVGNCCQTEMIASEVVNTGTSILSS